MLKEQPILIVEDDPLIAMVLADAVVSAEGFVVGPVASVKEALLLIGQQRIAGAILDANLADRDVTPVALQLAEQGIPFVIHSAVGLPAELAILLKDVAVVLKPQVPDLVIERLCLEIDADNRTNLPRSQQIGGSADVTVG
jgi:DNA-binding response OmpR family regulator